MPERRDSNRDTIHAGIGAVRRLSVGLGVRGWRIP